MRGGGGRHREKKSKIEKERSGSQKKIEQAHGQKAEVEPSRNVDEMYVLMEEQMRLMSEEAKSLHVTGEVLRRIVEHVVRMRLMVENMKKQASDDDLQRVEKMEQGLKVFMEEVRDRQKELETRETKEEQNVKMSPEDDVGRKATREGRGCAGLVQGGDETHRMNETCGKGKGKGNGGKGEHGGKGDKGGKGFQQSVKMMKGEEEQVTDEEDERVQVAPNMGAGGSHPQAMLDPEEEAVEEKEGTRKLRWADCEEEEEGMRQGAAEGEWHQARKEQGIMWLDGSYEEQEGHEGSAGGERCEVCGRVEVWSEESEEQEEEKQEEVKSEQEAREEEKRTWEAREEEKRAQEAREEESRVQKAQEEQRAQEAREEQSRAQEAREEERRAQEAREEQSRAQEESRVQEAREEERRAQEAREEEWRAQEAQVEERRAQEAREEQRRAQEAPELRRSEREVSAQEERTEQEREVEAQGRHESEVKAQEGHEGDVKAQGEQGEDANSVHEECHVSNRHMTWWHNAWWIRVDNGPHMRSARGRRRVWRAARRAAEQARDEDGAGEAQCLAEEAEREKRERRQTDRQTRQGSENTLHLVLHLPQNASATATATTSAAATRTLQ